MRRPLDRLGSIKLKLGIVIVVSVIGTLLVNEIGLQMNIKPVARGAVAVLFGLVLVQLLARGMTAPLREMARATTAMSAGHHGVAVTSTSRDEVGELARAFNAMSTELSQVDRMRRDLVANVSHELRTPISALRAQLENLVDGVQAPDPEVLTTMLRQTERLGRLVEQLLDLSRLESGAAPLQLLEFQLAEVLEAVADEARLHDDRVPIDVRLDPPDLATVADPERLHQVVANLVHNAVRHSPADAGVSVHARQLPAHVEIVVADQGPGIPREEAARVFERFYRADAARAGTEGGAGLGLAICRWIVDLHGGLIRVEPNTPAGCRMVVRLPGGQR